MNSRTRIKFLKARFRFILIAWFNSMCISIFNCNSRIAFHYKSILIFKTLQWLTFKLLLAHSLKQNNIPKLTSSMDYATFIGLYLQKCSKSALIKIFIHTFLRLYLFIFAHTSSLCIYSAKRCKYKKQNSFLTHNSEVSTSPWAEVSRFFLRRRTVRPSDRSQSTDRTQLRALCCSTSVTAPSATWVHLWNYK